MALTALEIKNLTCPEGRKQIKKHDANGLFILIKCNGSKLWRFRYRFAEKDQEMAIGKYPMIPLGKAREMAKEASILLVQGVNPMNQRRERKKSLADDSRNFKTIALKWWDIQKSKWTDDNTTKIHRWLTVDCKSIAKLDINEIDAAHITELMLTIEAKGHPKKCQPILSVISRVYSYALAHRLTRNNPAQSLSLKDILKPIPAVKHLPAVTNRSQLSELIKTIDENDVGSFCTVEALKLLPRLFLRPKEIRHLKWEYIDFEDDLIRIPAELMKRNRDHLVPISKQVKAQLLFLKEHTMYSSFIFPSERDSENPMSKNVLTNRLRALGYSADAVTAHGFRTTASTILHEMGWEHEAIETQLAHLTGTSTSRSYKSSDSPPEKKGDDASMVRLPRKFESRQRPIKVLTLKTKHYVWAFSASQLCSFNRLKAAIIWLGFILAL